MYWKDIWWSAAVGKYYQYYKTKWEKIPQLGEQEKQSCPPLKVSSDIANHPGLVPGTTLGDYVGDDVQFEKAEVVAPFIYQHGKPLVKSDDQLKQLPTMMRRLHEWYMDTCRKSGADSMLLRIKEEHDLIGVEVMPVEFVELFQLFNQDALDKQLMSCYCL